MTVALVDDERFDAHEAPGGGHPECPERLAAARDGLRGSVPQGLLRRLSPILATSEELTRVHDSSYVRALDGALASGQGQLDADTYFSAGSREAAWLAAGGAAALARELATGKSQRGVALLRPPGHHAEPHTAMGFCLLNNIAIAAQAARTAGARKVAIVDWDVHHGNGTQTAFYDDPNVLFVSLHQFPFYPGSGRSEETGRGPGLGKTINVPLPAGSGPDAYGDAFRRVVMPALTAFGADVCLVSAGFDAHTADPLASMCLDAETYRALASAILSLQVPVGFVLEGGYDLVALSDSLSAVGKAITGQALALPDGAARSDESAAIERTRSALAGAWPGVFA